MKEMTGKIIVIFLAVPMLLVALFFLRPVASLPIDTPQEDRISTVSLQQEFTAHIGETYTIIDDNSNYTTTFTLTGFYNHPCPPGAQCIWSGLDIFYKISGCPTNPQVLAPCFNYEKTKPLEHIDAPYFIESVVDSDYQTFAKIKLQTYASN
jgi:hypothetical protein